MQDTCGFSFGVVIHYKKHGCESFPGCWELMRRRRASGGGGVSIRIPTRLLKKAPIGRPSRLYCTGCIKPKQARIAFA